MTTNIKAIIIEDEPAAVDVIIQLCQLDSNIKIVGVASNGLDALKLLKEVSADLVFLDVDMPMMNGLEVLEQLPNHLFEIIFTTGSEQHAFQAFKYEALDYLLKPIDPIEFQNSIAKFRSRKTSVKALRKLAIPSQSEIIYVEEDQILYITGQGSYSSIYTSAKPGKFIISKNIGQVQEKLSADFFRCHNSHLINLKFVEKFINKEGFFVQMTNGELIEVSRRNKADLLNALSSLQENKR